MSILKEGDNSSIKQQKQLEEENRVLRDENEKLRSDNTKAKKKLKEHGDMEDRYEESQSRFETIFSQSRFGNKIIAPDLKIIQVNEALTKMLGYSEEELVGTKVIDFAHPDFVHHWVDLQHQLWTKQIPSFQIETCLLQKGGKGMWVQVTSIIFKDKGASLGYTIVEDIKERKGLEQNLKNLYEAQETILHMVAHDLQNPVNNISLLTDYLKENLEKPNLLEEQKEENLTFVKMISETCKKAFIIIKDLLFIGNLNHDVPLVKTEFTGYVEKELAKLGMESKKKGVNVNFESPKTPMYAQINQEKFSRVIENLLSNAIKFTKPGGKVTVSTKQEKDKVMLQVSDTGIGIPKKMRSKVFDKFTNANRQGTEGESTTGLGLFIVKQIVDLHKGTIWMDSEVNIGTSFYVELEASED